MKRTILLIVAGIMMLAVVIFQTIFNSVDTINQSKKKGQWVDTPLSHQANAYFWDQFHQGNYDSIPLILDRLTAAYLDNPNDLLTVYHLGFTHFWAIAEQQHQTPVPNTVIDHAVLAQKYLGEAYLLNPEDTRILSFLTAAKITVGAISQDDKLVTEGYLNGLKSIREWRDFGEFSLACTFGGLPHTDPNFQKALKWMQDTANRCYCKDFDPTSEACQEAIARRVDDPRTLGRKRIVPNSWVAPHNIEGFFMFWGDLLVKNGEWEEAIDIYQYAKHAPDYPHWDYREVLENRIANARRNVALFRKKWPMGEKISVDDAVMMQTSIACRGCHQMSNTDLATTYKNFDQQAYLDKGFYFLQ